MKSILAVSAFALVGLGVFAPEARAAPINYTFALAPENNSGVSGSGTMVLDGTVLTVSMTATGLVPNQLHPSHIHGLLGAAAPTTTIAPPTGDAPPNGNGDGFVQKPEGATFEGPPLFDLPPSGVRSGYSTAPGGVLSFTQTYDLSNTSLYDPDAMGLSLTLADIEGTTGGNTVPFLDRLIEIHGLGNVPASAAALNGTTLRAGTLGYDPEMPVAAGRIQLAATVPEPATFVLLGGALAGLGALRRRRALGGV